MPTTKSLLYNDPETTKQLDYFADNRNFAAIMKSGFLNGCQTLRITLDEEIDQPPKPARPQRILNKLRFRKKKSA